MEFVVTYANQISEDFEGEGAEFKILEYGVLRITEGAVKTYLSPSAWLRVEDNTPPKAPRSVRATVLN